MRGQEQEQDPEDPSSTGPTTGSKRPRPEEGSGDDMDDGEDDFEELAREERMAKKVRKGEISKDEFEAEFHDLT